jgi:hypothetical protein
MPPCRSDDRHPFHLTYRSGGIPWIIGRDPQKLESARAEISPTDPSCVRISSVDGNDTAAMSAFFAAVPAGTVHHMVCTWGESARCGDVRGTENFAKLQKQMAIKFDLQMRPVSMGADKVHAVRATKTAAQSAQVQL